MREEITEEEVIDDEEETDPDELGDYDLDKYLDEDDE